MIEKTKQFATKSLIRSVVLLVLCAPLTLVVFLKLIYYIPQKDDWILNSFLEGVKNLVTRIYQNIESVQFLWLYSPTPTVERLITPGNALSFLTVMGLFWGIASFLNGKKAIDAMASAKREAFKRELEDEYRKR